MSTKALKEVTKALQGDLTSKKTLTSLSPDSRRILQSFIDEHNGKFSSEESGHVNLELRAIWDKYVGENLQKQDIFMSVVKDLQPAIVPVSDKQHWASLVAMPTITGTGHTKAAIEDAQEFLVGTMLYDEDVEDSTTRAKLSNLLCKSLLDVYMDRTSTLAADESLVAPENTQSAQHVEDVLVAFGKKRPKLLFNLIDDLVAAAHTRLRALTLLNAFLRHETPHLYLVLNTPLVERLLKCLMNDTSTTILSVALTSLIMLLPHIPSSLSEYLPRLFLIYSRLLCWEKFSELSTEEQKNLVTDDRVAWEDEEDDSDDALQDVGIDSNWDKARPPPDTVESATPELMTYFTYLYGLYPLNFMSYVRRPRKYLKSVEFPAADSFDLDRAVIRSRTEQFREVHLLHPNFYHLTVEEELSDPKWPKMDPADVVGECQALCMHSKVVLSSPDPPPTWKVSDVPHAQNMATSRNHRLVSPVASHTSLRSGGSWRDTQSTAVSTGPKGDSPAVKPRSIFSDDGTLPDHLHTSPQDDKPLAPPQNNLEFLQRELTLLRNELSFERWHKAQYSQHISQIMRRNVKEATVEAETLNLINANRALKKQLEQVRKAREATIKDSTLTRKQANNLEANMTKRFNSLKLEQETWQADADELRRLRDEMKQYRDLLVMAEARELHTARQLELAQRDLEELKPVQDLLKNAMRRVQEYEHREFDFETALRERDRMRSEMESIRKRLLHYDEHRERMRKAYANKVADLEAQLGEPREPTLEPIDLPDEDAEEVLKQAFAESEAKFARLKNAHAKLLDKHTDLELQLEALQSGHSPVRGDGADLLNAHPADPFLTPALSTGSPKRRLNDISRVRSATVLPTLTSTTATMRTSLNDRAKSIAPGTSIDPGDHFTSGPPAIGDELKSIRRSDSTSAKPSKPHPDGNKAGAGRVAAGVKSQTSKSSRPDGNVRRPSVFKGFRGHV